MSENSSLNTNSNPFVKNWSLNTVLKSINLPETSTSSSPLSFLHVIERLKTTPREGWRRFDIKNGESIADHMYRMAVTCMLCPVEMGLDKDRCVKLALVHDMAEALVGDITPPDNVPKDEKYRRELESMTYICEQLLRPMSAAIADEFMGLWTEYETGETREALFVKDVDKFELLVQCIEYEKREKTKKDLSEFLHVHKGIQGALIRGWAVDVITERDALWAAAAANADAEGKIDS